MCLPFRALLYPSSQKIDLPGAKRSPRVDGRHARFGFRSGDAFDQPAAFSVTRNDDSGFAKRAIFGIESKAGLSLGWIRAVTGETGVGQNRANVAVEVDGGGCLTLLVLGKDCCRQHHSDK